MSGFHTTTCIGRRSDLWHVLELWAYRVKSLWTYTPADDVQNCFSMIARGSTSRMNQLSHFRSRSNQSRLSASVLPRQPTTYQGFLHFSLL
jgi:hypothetical protein